MVFKSGFSDPFQLCCGVLGVLRHTLDYDFLWALLPRWAQAFYRLPSKTACG